VYKEGKERLSDQKKNTGTTEARCDVKEKRDGKAQREAKAERDGEAKEASSSECRTMETKPKTQKRVKKYSEPILTKGNKKKGNSHPATALSPRRAAGTACRATMATTTIVIIVATRRRRCRRR
jgi:hypothetical protein